MDISSIFIRKPIMTVLLVATVILFGVLSYLSIPISDLPEVDPPVITINASFPGASPETMASSVASPLENQCMMIPGLDKIISTSSEGSTQIVLTFSIGKDVDLVAPDVQAAISRASAYLPAMPNPPSYKKYNPSDDPIVYLTVQSKTMRPEDLYDFANKRVAQRLNMVNGVSEVDCYGPASAVVVKVNPEKLAAYNMGLNDVSDLLQSSTQMTSGGSINGTYKAYAIEPKGQLTKASEYNDLILKSSNGEPLKISDIGKAYDSTDNELLNILFWQKDRGYYKNQSVIFIRRTPGSNTITVNNKIMDLLAQIKKEIPKSMDIELLHDRAKNIITSIKDVEFTLLLAFILVVLVIFIFLGRLSDTIIPAITLPLSLLLTFIFMYIFNFTLDNLSLMALILAVGFVVDDAIVVLENTVRLIEEGMKPFDAAIESAKEITGTIISMTLSLMIVFVPLVFMSGLVGKTFREFSLTVIIAILSSGIISLTLSPMMCARMLKPDSAYKNKGTFHKTTAGFINWLILWYGKSLKFTLKNKYLSVAAWVLCIAGTIIFYMLTPKGFLPIGDSGFIKGGIIMPLGVSSNMAAEFQKSMCNILDKNPFIERFIVLSGLSSGADQSTGFMMAVLKDDPKRPSIEEATKDIWMSLMKNPFPLGMVFLQPVPVLHIATGGEHTAQGSKYSFSISGPDENAVYKCADELTAKMSSDPIFEGVQSSVKLNMPQLNIELKRDRASTLGITAKDIETAIALAYTKTRIAQYVTPVNQYDVVMQVDDKFMANPEDLSKLYIKSPVSGQMVPFTDVATVKKVVGPQQVLHSQQLVAANVSFNIMPNIPLGVATNKIQSLANNILQPGMIGNFQGEAQEFQKAIQSMIMLILLAIFLKYVVLGILYESYIHPFTVLTTLPVAAFGGIGTLLLFGSEMDLYAYVGLFMLLGIIAKNGIMMVDFAKQNREKGKNMYDAIYEASIVRFRPILMTGLAAIMGALPIAIGIGSDGAGRRSLGLMVVGGLIFSQIITLYITPGIYLYMEAFQEKFLDKFELTRSDAVRKELDKK